MRQVAHGIVTESGHATLSADAAAAGYPSGSYAGLVSNDGSHCDEQYAPVANCDVWCTVPISWLDVTFVLRGRCGEVWVELDRRTLGQASYATRGPSGVTALLFEFRGDPCDEFEVRGYKTPIAHQVGTFIMRVWACDCSPRVVSPWAQLHDELHATVQTLLPAIVAVIPAPAMLGRSLYVSGVSVSHSDAAAPLGQVECSLLATGPFGVVVLRTWLVSLAGVVEAFTKPVALPVAGGISFVASSLVPAAGVRAIVNVSAFEGQSQ
jgi:hypothetical protein